MASVGHDSSVSDMGEGGVELIMHGKMMLKLERRLGPTGHTRVLVSTARTNWGENGKEGVKEI